MAKVPRVLAGAAVLIAGVFLTVRSSADALYFPPPGDWARIEPARAGWNAAALDAALEYAHTVRSSGVVVLVNGRILAERAWTVDAPAAGYARMRIGTATNGQTIEDVASAQKSVVAFLAGVAEGQGLLDLNARVSKYLGPGWSKAERTDEDAITVRHLMTMTSGLTDGGAYQQPAGKVWRYNTGMYSRMIGVLGKATGKDIDTLTRDWLTAPTGMTDSRWVKRAWAAGNDAANSIGFATTARDLARFGLLIQATAVWNGRDLLKNRGYLRRMLSPSQDLNPSYGLLWWLNGQPRAVLAGAQERAGMLIPAAPRDLVAAQGALDRKCYIVPSLGLVVTRLGEGVEAGDVGSAFNNEFWTLLMKAAPR